MRKVIIEHDKKREVIKDGGYTYKEGIKGSDGDIEEFFTMVKESDYSFYYMNGTDEVKDGKLTIEIDSAFYDAFNHLVGEDEEFKIDDDYSERYILMKRNESGEVEVIIHLLPGEYDASIELKNIMFDMRSRADAEGKDIKGRLSVFFDELMQVLESIPEEEVRVPKLSN